MGADLDLAIEGRYLGTDSWHYGAGVVNTLPLPEPVRRLSARLDRMAEIEDRWNTYFHDSLMAFIQRGEAPGVAVMLAKEAATDATEALTQRYDVYAAERSALILRGPTP